MYDMQNAMDGGAAMGGAMGWVWLLLAVALVLTIAALIKYLFFSGPRR